MCKLSHDAIRISLRSQYTEFVNPTTVLLDEVVHSTDKEEQPNVELEVFFVFFSPVRYYCILYVHFFPTGEAPVPLPGFEDIPDDEVFAYPSKKEIAGMEVWPSPAEAEKTQELGDREHVALRSPRLATGDDFFCATRRQAEGPSLDPSARFGGESCWPKGFRFFNVC